MGRRPQEGELSILSVSTSLTPALENTAAVNIKGSSGANWRSMLLTESYLGVRGK